jgi:hypothetical protein
MLNSETYQKAKCISHCLYRLLLHLQIHERYIIWEQHTGLIQSSHTLHHFIFLQGLRHTWEDNIKIDLKEMWSKDVDWINLALDRVQWCSQVNTVMNIWVRQKKWGICWLDKELSSSQGLWYSIMFAYFSYHLLVLRPRLPSFGRWRFWALRNLSFLLFRFPLFFSWPYWRLGLFLASFTISVNK